MSCAIWASPSSVKLRWPLASVQSRIGICAIDADDQIGNSVSPCSPNMAACTLERETPAHCAMAQRNRDVSSRVPVESTRLTGNPLTLCATTVRTSQGFVTSTRTALGACSSRSGVTADSVSGSPSCLALRSAIDSRRRIRPATASFVIGG